MTGGRRPATGRLRLRGREYDRLESRQPDRDGDPLASPDGCSDCAGTGINLTAANPAAGCGSCDGTGWRQ